MTQTVESAFVSTQQRLAVEEFRLALDGAQTCALADFPRHLNVGDSAIWAGERAALRTLGVRVTAVCDSETYAQQAERFARDAGEVLCFHGGGNFGDLYARHHALRETLLESFRDRPFIQLPASINFSGPSALARTRRLIQEHGDVTIMTRDRASEAFAKEQFDARVILTPDAAFALGPLPRFGSPVFPVVRLARTDPEAADEGVVGGGSFDWLRPEDWRRRREHELLEVALGLAAGRLEGGAAILPNQALRAYDSYANWNVKRGRRLLSRGEVVITDRLHGHILCLLMSRPHVLLDDRFGKLSSYWSTWTAGAPGAVWADGVHEATRVAREMAES